jgi:hypothetical protein
MIGRDLDFDLHNAIQDLIAEGVLEENSDAHRVARLVIHDGYDSLTPAQQTLYDAVVTPALRTRKSEGKRLGVAAS